MEPFGLFHLLNSLLSTPSNEEPKTEEPIADEVPKTPPNQPLPPTNACVDFFMQHERRARRK